jgi:hypothetical protein
MLSAEPLNTAKNIWTTFYQLRHCLQQFGACLLKQSKYVWKSGFQKGDGTFFKSFADLSTNQGKLIAISRYGLGQHWLKLQGIEKLFKSA